MKISKHTEDTLKELYGEHPSTCHLDSTVNVLFHTSVRSSINPSIHLWVCVYKSYTSVLFLSSISISLPKEGNPILKAKYSISLERWLLKAPSLGQAWNSIDKTELAGFQAWLTLVMSRKGLREQRW